jgi:hypothetical protein
MLISKRLRAAHLDRIVQCIVHANSIALRESAIQMSNVGCEPVRAVADGVVIFLLPFRTSYRGMFR